MITVAEAQALIINQARSFGVERVPLEESFGRVLAEDVRADRDYPPFNRSAMDGYAIVAEKFANQKDFPVQGTIYAGDLPATPGRGVGGVTDRSLSSVGAVKIMTGAAVPAPFNAVIRREDAVEQGGAVRFFSGPAQVWHNISRQGEDLARGEKVPTRGRVIDNATASLLASLGVVRPQVARVPTVAMISTGNEIIPPGKKPNPVELRNSNAVALKCQLRQFGIEHVAHVHAADDRKKLQAAIAKYGKVDILLMTGGVSAGDSDYVPGVLTKLKFKNIFHRVQMKPGKPLWFGKRGKTVVFAIPGNPLSAQVIFRIFVEPYVRQCLGLALHVPLALPLAEGRRKKDSLENFFPVRIETRENRATMLGQIPFNSSGDIRAALFSDGLAVHPAAQPELAAGSVVSFYPWSSF